MMLHDESAHTETIKAIGLQIGVPPPAALRIALVESLGGAPDVVAAVLDAGENQTTWDAYGCRGGLIATAHGHKAVKDWRGGGGQDHHDDPGEVAVSVRRIADIWSIDGDSIRVLPQFGGLAVEARIKWTLRFADHTTIELDEHHDEDDGRHFAAIARHVRERFDTSAWRNDQ